MNWLGDHETTWQPGLAIGKYSRVIVTSNDRMIAVDANGNPLLLNLDDAAITDHELVLAGTLNDVNYYGVRGEKIDSLQYEPLRPTLIQIRSAQFVPVSAAMQVLDFSREHQFCGQCGRPTTPSESDRGRTCESCQLTQYPRISPCVIVLVTRGRNSSCKSTKVCGWYVFNTSWFCRGGRISGACVSQRNIRRSWSRDRRAYLSG